MNSKIAMSGILISLLLSGCAVKEKTNSVNQKITINKNKNIQNNSNFVNVETEKPISELLQNLSSIDGKFYHLEGNDTVIPSLKDFKTITSFNALDQYVQSTTGKTLVITKNKYVTTGVKSVKIVDKQILQVNNILESTTLNAEVQNLNLKDSISKISSIVGFNIIYSQDLENEYKPEIKQPKEKKKSKNKTEPVVQSQRNDLLKPSNFTNGTALDFFSYAENHYDIFIDINYKDKLINVSKYKNKELSLHVKTSDLYGVTKSDLKSDLVRDLNPSVNQSGIEKYIDFQKKLSSITQNTKNTVKVDINKGRVDIYATRNMSKILSDEIYKFNSSLEKTEGLSVSFIEEVINDNFKNSSQEIKENVSQLKISDIAKIYLYAIERDYSIDIKNNILNHVLLEARKNEKIDYEYFEIIMKNQNKVDIKDMINDITEITSDYKKILLER